MIFNLKDIDLNNYISWVYSSVLQNGNEIDTINSKIADTGWVSLQLQNNVKLFTEGYDLQIRKKYGVVYMRGRITNLTSYPTTITTLPQQFRPRDGYSFRFVVPSNGGTNAVFVFNPDSGTVILDFTSDGNVPAERWFSFNNVSYISD